MSDPVTAVPDELRTAPTRPVGALGLLRLHDFRNVFLAVAASEVGDALALAGSLWIAVAGAFAAALGQSSAVVLLNSAAQEEVPDSLLGRVIGLISLTHRGGHATGLLLVSPLFAFIAPRAVFVVAALALPVVGLVGAAVSVGSVRGRLRRGRSGQRPRNP